VFNGNKTNPCFNQRLLMDGKTFIAVMFADPEQLQQ